MKLTPYRVACAKLPSPCGWQSLRMSTRIFPCRSASFAQAKPDLILIPGDLTEQREIRAGGAESLRFLAALRELAPVVYAAGNHEVGCFHADNPDRRPSPQPLPADYRAALAACGVLSVENECRGQNGILFCGLGTGIHDGKNEPDAALLDRFRALPPDPVKILLCHHPEYYPAYLADLGMDLIVCGHAHGGQWRLFGRGIYAPGQGLFPRYTSGLHGGVCVISRGLSGCTRIPRIFNPPEIPLIEFGG